MGRGRISTAVIVHVTIRFYPAPGPGLDIGSGHDGPKMRNAPFSHHEGGLADAGPRRLTGKLCLVICSFDATAASGDGKERLKKLGMDASLPRRRCPAAVVASLIGTFMAMPP
jgi:hypothetical protein